VVQLLSFPVVQETLTIPADLLGRVWHYRSNASALIEEHRHYELELNLVLRGSGTYLIRGRRRYRLHAGSLVWLFPAQDHLLLDRSADFEMWIAVFRPGLVQQIGGGARTIALREPDPAGYFCKNLPIGALRRLADLYAQLPRHDADALTYNAGLSYALLASWSAHLESAADALGVDLHPAVEQATRLLREDANRVSLSELAGRCGISPGRLSRLFHEQTGMRLTEFRNQQRLRKFFDHYGDGRRSTTLRAAARAGFGSYAQFYRVFRASMHCSPAEYWRSGPDSAYRP